MVNNQILFSQGIAMITNQPFLADGLPRLWPSARRLSAETALLYAPQEEWTYSHHPHIARFQNRWYAIWSCGWKDEDDPGQRVMLAESEDFLHWSAPRVLLEPEPFHDGRLRVLTAGGFHAYGDVLAAYAGDYGPGKEDTRLLALTTRDGKNWSEPRSMGIPVCPNFGPQPTASGRLIITGNISFPYTDDPSGLFGWTMTGIYPPEMAGTSDDPAAFWPVAERMGWPAALCEGAFHQTPDGTLHMLLRATGPGFRHWLWLSESTDNGSSWSAPTETRFSDDNAKFHTGRLPDGRYYCVGNPVEGDRCPLIVSLSEDGLQFTQHYLLADALYTQQKEGRWKEGEYGYPHTVVEGGYLHVIVSRRKEGIQVLRTSVASFS